MNVFVTGGTGLVGTAVVTELRGHGHTVLALARSGASAQAIDAAGGEPLRGSLADLGVLRAGAARADGVIHLAFANDFSSPEALAHAVAEESAALAALGDELVGSNRPFAAHRPQPRSRRICRFALEQASAGTSWHAVADEGDAVRDIAAVIGRRLGLPVESLPQESFGPLGPIFAADQPSSSAHTREVLGWRPTHPSLLDDLENLEP